MKRRKIKDPLSAGEKQGMALGKAIFTAINTISEMLKSNKILEKDVKDHIVSRFKSVQQKYGYNKFMVELPSIITIIKERKIAGNVLESIEEYYNKLK